MCVLRSHCVGINIGDKKSESSFSAKWVKTAGLAAKESPCL